MRNTQNLIPVTVYAGTRRNGQVGASPVVKFRSPPSGMNGGNAFWISREGEEFRDMTVSRRDGDRGVGNSVRRPLIKQKWTYFGVARNVGY